MIHVLCFFTVYSTTLGLDKVALDYGNIQRYERDKIYIQVSEIRGQNSSPDIETYWGQGYPRYWHFWLISLFAEYQTNVKKTKQIYLTV